MQTGITEEMTNSMYQAAKGQQFDLESKICSFTASVAGAAIDLRSIFITNRSFCQQLVDKTVDGYRQNMLAIIWDLCSQKYPDSLEAWETVYQAACEKIWHDYYLRKKV